MPADGTCAAAKIGKRDFGTSTWQLDQKIYVFPCFGNVTVSDAFAVPCGKTLPANLRGHATMGYQPRLA
jgi:hypothetical protein